MFFNTHAQVLRFSRNSFLTSRRECKDCVFYEKESRKIIREGVNKGLSFILLKRAWTARGKHSKGLLVLRSDCFFLRSCIGLFVVCIFSYGPTSVLRESECKMAVSTRRGSRLNPFSDILICSLLAYQTFRPVITNREKNKEVFQ